VVAGGGERERTRADGDDAGTAGVGIPQRVEDGRIPFPHLVVEARHHDCVGRGERLEPVVDPDADARIRLDIAGARPADQPLVRNALTRLEDLNRDGDVHRHRSWQHEDGDTVQIVHDDLRHAQRAQVPASEWPRSTRSLGSNPMHAVGRARRSQRPATYRPGEKAGVALMRRRTS
jgi:hypothetical protein